MCTKGKVILFSVLTNNLLRVLSDLLATDVTILRTVSNGCEQRENIDNRGTPKIYVLKICSHEQHCKDSSGRNGQYPGASENIYCPSSLC